MKYMKRSNMYRSAKCLFNPETTAAFSSNVTKMNFNKNKALLHFRTQYERVLNEARNGDDSASEFCGEVHSVIDVMQKPESTYEEIYKAAEWVGLTCWLIGHGD